MGGLLKSSKIVGESSESGNKAISQTGDTTGYSKLVYWEVWNFMSVEHARVDFDEKNIVNFKGYNDSGKSAMMRALDVLMFNYKPSHQTDFIKDGKTYFRVIAGFDDGVFILRDKYANGQSLYEMYKGGQCIFTTKQGDFLTKVKDVPEPIAKYLGLIDAEGTILNSRSCFDKQLLVQTSGSDNYRFLNSVLKSEEIAVANELINIDKNKLSTDMNTLETELGIYKNQVELARGINKSMVSALVQYDSDIDSRDAQMREIGECSEILEDYFAVPNIPELSVVDSDRLSILSVVEKASNELSSVEVSPELPSITGDKLVDLKSCLSLAEQCDSEEVPPEVGIIGHDRLSDLAEIADILREKEIAVAELSSIEDSIKVLEEEGTSLANALNAAGRPQVRCKNCGALVDIGSCEHVH